MTAVKGLAEATGRKAIAISNLQALAWYGSRRLRGVVLDARRGEVYGAVYNSALELVQEEIVAPRHADIAGDRDRSAQRRLADRHRPRWAEQRVRLAE